MRFQRIAKACGEVCDPPAGVIERNHQRLRPPGIREGVGRREPELGALRACTRDRPHRMLYGGNDPLRRISKEVERQMVVLLARPANGAIGPGRAGGPGVEAIADAAADARDFTARGVRRLDCDE